MIAKFEIFLTTQPDANEAANCTGYVHKDRQALYRTLKLDSKQAEVIFQRIEDFATGQLTAFMGPEMSKVSTKIGYRV